MSTFRRPSVQLKTKAEIGAMRKAGLIAGQALLEVKKHMEPGISTKQLDDIAEKFIRSCGAKPTFIGYRGYPASLCVSINDEVVHGIPSDRKIKAGDVVSVDVAATIGGFVGDTATTFIVGKASSRKAVELVEATRNSLFAAIDMMKVGNRLGDVGAAVQNFVEPLGYGVVRDFVGHGIGHQMHEEPAVPNYGKPGTGIRLEVGMVLAIEPMVTLGSYDVKVLPDGWTVVTLDGSLAAHFEHTVAVTEDGPQILTKAD